MNNLEDDDLYDSVSFPVNSFDAHASLVPSASLPAMVAFLCVGLLLKRSGVWRDSYTTTFRRLIFGVLQPLTVLRSIWIARFDPQLYAVAAVSLAVHVWLALFWWWVFRGVKARQIRGWLLVSVQGCLVSFLYTTVGGSVRFGERAAAVCLLWDIGGNMWISQGLVYVLTAMHAPEKKDECEGDLEEEPLVKVTDVPFEIEGVKQIKPIPSFPVMQIIMRQPVLPLALLGLLLNSANVGVPPTLNEIMFSCSRAFRFGLYIMLGLYTTIANDIVSVRLIAGALGIRLIVAAIVALLIWLYLPLSGLVKTTMAMAMLAPASTMTINLLAEFGYSAVFTEMSATLTTISVGISFLIEQVVIAFY